ncbi:hypothetical protein JTB14_029149 [Gonioctena quinquepunctata]|nr:hypothetical protein JTB14_029149 [Gonioctena quinquepunctata]
MDRTFQDFSADLHEKYLLFILNGKLPSSLSSLDSNRSLLLYFAISGLDVLGKVDNIPTERRESIISWIYSLQVVDDEGDDLSEVNRGAILKSLRTLQLPNGSFKGAKLGVENDMRFIFCAASICYILDDWSAIDVEMMVKFVLNSISYDGGIGQDPELESHCGSTFCAIAALALSNNLNRLRKKQVMALRRWLLFRFDGGFNGRPNKPIDTCYSFWTGGALKILDSYDFINNYNNHQFILMTQDKYGGFSKWVNVVPDPMHTYLGLAGLSLMNFGDLSEMCCELNITKRTLDHLKRVQQKWK